MRAYAIGMLASVLSVACGPTAFGCLDDAQCIDDGAQGVCQPTGNCSFPDDACPSGQRYGEHSNDGFADECVPLEGDSATTGSSSPSGSASASATTGDTAGESGSSSPSTTLTTSPGTTDGETTGDVPVTAGQTETSTTGVETSGGTSIGETGIDTNAVTTGQPAEGCSLYCDVLAGCNEQGNGCVGDCEAGLDIAEGFGEPCENALEDLMDCRSGLSCGDLSVHLAYPLDPDYVCAPQVFAVGAACPLSGCTELCDVTAGCMIDAISDPCADGCSGSTFANLLEGGGQACLDANEGFYGCLAEQSCSTLAQVFNDGQLVACDQFLPQVSTSCPS